jgi:hypothetical protein
MTVDGGGDAVCRDRGQHRRGLQHRRAFIENDFRVLFNPHQGYRAEAAGGSLRAALTGVRENCIACAGVMFSPNECLV